MDKEVYFYQQNTKVLTFNIKKDQAKILFNHYITQKENLQRMKNELPRGYFYMAINTAAEDTGLSVQQIRTLIKQFIELGIIKKVQEFPRYLKKPTIWEYVSCREGNYQGNTLTNNQNNIQEPSNFKRLDVLANSQNVSHLNIQDNNSKKELSKEKIINIPMYEDSLKVLNLYPNNIGEQEAIAIIPKLIEKYGIEQMVRCVTRYSHTVKGRDERYVKYASTFFKRGYIDYLDENYKGPQIITDNKLAYDEETGEVIRR